MTSIEELRWEPISRDHKRKDFDCGHPALERWLRHHARKNDQRGACLTEVLVPTAEREHIIGFVSLSAFGLDTSQAPDSIRGFEHLDQVPAILLARMGRDLLYKGQGVGDVLFKRARERALATSRLVGVALLVVDAKHGKAGWYEERGFVQTEDEPDRLVLPIKSMS